VDAYLLDTSILSAYLDPNHQFHNAKRMSVDALPATSARYISVIALAELTFGVELALAMGRGDMPALRKMLVDARAYGMLEVSHHTATAYAELKSKMGAKYLAKALRRDRPKYVEDWVDQATGRALGVDENDLWMCAQAKERGLVFVTGDGKIQRIADADPDVRILVI
jgi:predicted nucleic acid-binding protein